MPVSRTSGSAVRFSRTAPTTSPSTATAQVASPSGPSSPGRRSRWNRRNHSMRSGPHRGPATGGVTSSGSAPDSAAPTSRASTVSSTGSSSTPGGRHRLPKVERLLRHQVAAWATYATATEGEPPASPSDRVADGPAAAHETRGSTRSAQNRSTWAASCSGGAAVVEDDVGDGPPLLVGRLRGDPRAGVLRRRGRAARAGPPGSRGRPRRRARGRRSPPGRSRPAAGRRGRRRRPPAPPSSDLDRPRPHQRMHDAVEPRPGRGSANTTAASAGRSSAPSAASTPSPERLDHRRQPGRARLDDLAGDRVGVDDRPPRARPAGPGDGALARSDPAGQPDAQHARTVATDADTRRRSRTDNSTPIQSGASHQSHQSHAITSAVGDLPRRERQNPIMSRPTHAGSPTTRAARRGAGRHRLGAPTGVRCSDIPAVRERMQFQRPAPGRATPSCAGCSSRAARRPAHLELPRRAPAAARAPRSRSSSACEPTPRGPADVGPRALSRACTSRR